MFSLTGTLKPDGNIGLILRLLTRGPCECSRTYEKTTVIGCDVSTTDKIDEQTLALSIPVLGPRGASRTQQLMHRNKHPEMNIQDESQLSKTIRSQSNAHLDSKRKATLGMCHYRGREMFDNPTRPRD